MWETLENVTSVNRVNLNKNERLISLIGGMLLLLYAAVRVPLTAVLALCAAAYLIFRGLRGFCYFYDQLGLNTAVQEPGEAQSKNGTPTLVETADLAKTG